MLGWKAGSLAGTTHLYRYEELKSLAGGLKADADGMAFTADKAYQGSLGLLSSLSRLTEMDISSFEVRALCLSEQEIPFYPFWCPPCSSYPQLSPSQGSIPFGETPDRCHLPTLFPPFASSSWRDAGDPTVCLFQEEASRLKQDSSALLGLVDTSLAQYRGLQGRVEHWEEETKQLLQGQEDERGVRAWGHPSSLWGMPVAPPLSLPSCLRQLCLPGAGLDPPLGLVFTSQCVQGAAGVSHLHVRQVEDLILQRLELR